jgi:hypothetical protein
MQLTAAVGVAGALTCAILSTLPSWPRPLAERFAIDAAPFDPPGILGLRLKRYAPIDAVALVPPDTEVWGFKLYAERAIVVDIKHFPFSDHGIAEWRRRISNILGVPYERGLDIDAAWAAVPPLRIAAVAQRYGARYVLTRDAWHPQLPGQRLDREGGWSIWEIAPLPVAKAQP